MNLASSSLLVLTPGDDVAVARGDIAKGQELFADGLGVTALADIASGHKIALRGVAQGQPVRKYVPSTLRPCRKPSACTVMRNA